VDREAFARAWRFLGYQPVSKWTALVAAVFTAVFYVALLVVLGLFADLVTNRGRIPSLAELSSNDRDALERDWIEDLTHQERSERLESIGLDKKTAADLAAIEDFSKFTPIDQELIWRARVHEMLDQSVGATAAALVLPDFDNLPLPARAAFLKSWSALPVADRDRQLDQIKKGMAGNRSQTAAAQLPQNVQQALWRSHLRSHIAQTDPEAADLYWDDRRRLEEIGDISPQRALHDRGILSLIVRGRLHVPDRFYVPVIAAAARGLPWSWRPGEGTEANFNYLRGLLAFALLVALVRAASLSLMYYAAASAVIEATSRLRRAVYHHTYRLGTLAFRALGPSEAVGIFTRQIEAVHDALFTWLTVVASEPVRFGLLLVFALILNVWLSLVFLIFAVLVWLIGGQIAAHVRTRERMASRHAAEQLAMLQESLMLMRLVKSYTMELFNQSRVERQLSNYADVQMLRYRSDALYRPLLTFLGTAAAVVLLFVAGQVVLSGRLGVARGVTLATALVSLYSPVVTWIKNRKSIRRGRAAAAILFKFLDRPGEVGQVVGAEFLPPLADRLEFDNVSLREPVTGRPLLQGVTLTVPAGRRVAIVGPDEMEKHAFVYLIPRLLDPDSGEIRIDRHNLRWVTFDSLRAQIGVVVQHHLLFNDTAANNIGCGDPSFDLPKIIEAAKIAHAHHFIQKLPRGYETPIGELGHTLNLGESFRVALARAILRDPALLIIEEPLTMLDEDTKALLDDTFSRILPGRTVIFLPHRISTIRSCDTVFLMHNGRIEAAGEHRELLAQSELYRHLQYLEFNVFAEELAAKGA
jgi:ATP-binding cassette subfamily B protein